MFMNLSGGSQKLLKTLLLHLFLFSIGQEGVFSIKIKVYGADGGLRIQTLN